MEQVKQTIKKTIELMGFPEAEINWDGEGRKFIIFINENEWFKEWVPKMISDLMHLTRLVAKKFNLEDQIYIDINNYRKDREKIIIDLARAAARKVLITKNEVKLPVMNAYERRLIHTELATRPDVKTESTGERSERCVVVKPLI